MNRRNFFKNIVATSIVTVVAPHVILAETKAVESNYGLFHQLKRGKIIQYSRPGGITKEDIREAVEYVFRNYTPPERGYVFRTSERNMKIMNYYILNGITYST